jgi:hypothetical protein
MFLKAPFNFSKSPHFPPVNHIVRGEEGVPGIIFLVEYNNFCYLGVHAKFQTPTTNLSI